MERTEGEKIYCPKTLSGRWHIFFRTHTEARPRQTTLPHSTDQEKEIAETAFHLMRAVRRSGQAVRLIGVGVSGLGPPIRQLGLWDTDAEKSRKLQEAVDELREKYGETVIHQGELK